MIFGKTNNNYVKFKNKIKFKNKKKERKKTCLTDLNEKSKFISEILNIYLRTLREFRRDVI